MRSAVEGLGRHDACLRCLRYRFALSLLMLLLRRLCLVSRSDCDEKYVSLVVVLVTVCVTLLCMCGVAAVFIPNVRLGL